MSDEYKPNLNDIMIESLIETLNLRLEALHGKPTLWFLLCQDNDNLDEVSTVYTNTKDEELKTKLFKVFKG